MSKIKFLLTLALIAVSTSVMAMTFDTNLPLKGKSIASSKLQSDSLFSVYSFAIRCAEPNCQAFAVTNTEVSKPKQNGSWEEIWTIDACRRTVRIPVNFIEDSTGVTKYNVDPMNVHWTLKK